MSKDYGSANVSWLARTVRFVVPWLALVVVVWAIVGIWGDFARSAGHLPADERGSGTPSSTATSVTASVTTTVTGLVATARIDLTLRSEPGTSTAIVATSREGSALEILARQGAWFRVKDAAGHVGWIPNDTKYIAVRFK